MCGRYVLALRPSQVRQRLADQNMPADEAPADDDEQIRQSYNFAPGYHGLIYRAATSERGTNTAPHNDNEAEDGDGEPSPKKRKVEHQPSSQSHEVNGLATKETKYKLQAAKWGLIPFWTKRSPDYGSMMRTINCRDDSLIENRGMWNTMKQRKRCIVVAEGFYEWLKKNGGKERVPHYVKRKDGGLMCFAGLWDCVRYEKPDASDENEREDPLYTYTVITTDANQQIRFLHDRMPVILEPASEEMRMWLDPNRIGWDKELQSMLTPFSGELEIYPVDKAVGKVGNNSPQFVVPVDSKENKKNIANFFGNQAKQAGSPQKTLKKEDANQAGKNEQDPDVKTKEPDEPRATSTSLVDPESNAPLPKPPGTSEAELSLAIKREEDSVEDSAMLQAADSEVERGIKREIDVVKDEDLVEAEKSPPPTKLAKLSASPEKNASRMSAPPEKKVGGMPENVKTSQKMRSATSNNTIAKSPAKVEGNKKITAFFGK